MRPAVWLDAEALDAAERQARRVGCGNCWTGTSGTVASTALHLVRMVRHLTQEAPVKDPNHPGYGDPPATKAEELLDIATRTIRQRRSTYGPPGEHFAKTVAAVNAILGHKLREPLTVSDWAQIMILDKLARHQGNGGTTKSADTCVDLAGYAACLAEVESCSTPSS
jgi:hypothetical protein